MAKKTFALNTEPHVATVGDTDLLFKPEVMGDEFMDALHDLQEVQKAASGVDLEDLQNLDADALRKTARALRGFLAELMLPASAELFTRVDVVADGKVVASYGNREEADKHAEGIAGAKAVDTLRLPDRILVQLMEWVIELYGGGADERPPTSSSGSATRSPKGGRRGMGVSPSKASTPAAGR
ncbi:hypothetical protein ACOZDE_18640 [Streptomyces griseoincarnatus]